MDSEWKKKGYKYQTENNLEKSAFVHPLTVPFNLPGEDDHLRAQKQKSNISNHICSHNSCIKLDSSKQEPAPIFIIHNHQWDFLGPFVKRQWGLRNHFPSPVCSNRVAWHSGTKKGNLFLLPWTVFPSGSSRVMDLHQGLEGRWDHWGGEKLLSPKGAF